MTTAIQFSSETAWCNAVYRAHRQHLRAGWEMIILLRDGIDQLGRNDQEREKLYEMASDRTDLTVGTLKHYVSVARSFGAGIALELELSFSHARTVASLPEDAAEHWLHEAKANGWQPEKLAKEVFFWKQKNALTQVRTVDAEVTARIVEAPTVNPQDTRLLHESLREVNRSRWLTTTGASLPARLSDEESEHLANYGQIVADMLNWTRGDHYNRLASDQPDAALHLAEQYQVDAGTLTRNALTARAFPPERRRQTTVLSYLHHELLRDQPPADADQWLDVADRQRWTPAQLAAQLRPAVETLHRLVAFFDQCNVGVQMDAGGLILTTPAGTLTVSGPWHLQEGAK